MSSSDVRFDLLAGRQRETPQSRNSIFFRKAGQGPPKPTFWRPGQPANCDELMPGRLAAPAFKVLNVRGRDS